MYLLKMKKRMKFLSWVFVFRNTELKWQREMVVIERDEFRDKNEIWRHECIVSVEHISSFEGEVY